jgi:uncharacterized repeat protein (TIGR01451 family)
MHRIMDARMLRPLLFAVAVLAGNLAGAQERPEYVPVSPTLGERFGQMRDNLFGAEPNQQQAARRTHPRAQSALNVRPQGSGSERSNGTPRPNPAANVLPRQGATGRSYAGTAAMTGRPSQGEAPQPPGAQNVSPDQIEQENIPLLSRRSSFSAPSAAGSLGGTPGVHASRGSLQDRLGAAQQSADASGLNNGGMDQNPNVAPANGPQSSRRMSPFSPAAGSASKIQHVINPTVSQPAGNVQHVINPTVTQAPPTPETAVPSLARSPQRVFAGAAGEKAATEARAPAGLTSSRRNVGSPAERIAAASVRSDRVPSAEASDAAVLFKRQSPSISVETTGPRTIVIGKEATFTVVVQNAGDLAAQDVVVAVRVPEWAEVVSTKESSGTAHIPQGASQPLGGAASGGAAAANAVQWSLARLDARSKETLSLQIVPRQSQPFDLAVQWTVMPTTSHAQVLVQEPKLTMDLSGPSEVNFGDTKVYKMTLANPGTGDADGVTIFLSPLSNQSAPPTKHQIGTIRAGDHKVIEVELTARQAGKVVIRAAATADGGLQAEVSEEVTVRRAELELKIAAGKAKYAGTVASYQIEIANPGNAPAENVQISAALPAGAKFVSSNGGQPAADGGKISWTLPTLRAGGATVLELKCQVNNPGPNRLAVHSTAEGELTASAEEVVNVEALADLKLDVIEPKGPVAVGEEVTYEIRVHNRGTKAAHDVKVLGYFSGQIDPIGATGGEHRLVPGIVIFKPIATLAAGGQTAFKVNARAKAPGSHMFKAEVVCEAVGAKLGSEHTTLFYGDETAGPQAMDRMPADESPRPLTPKTVFPPEEQEKPQPPRGGPLFGPEPKPGSAYGPAPASGAQALPVSPFTARQGGKK